MTEPTITAVVYLPPGYAALEAIAPLEALSLVPGCRAMVVADRPGPVVNDGGAITIDAGAGIDDIDHADVLVVPGGRVVPLLDDRRTLTWIRHIHETSEVTAAMCVGQALLGAAGLLHGVRVARIRGVPLPDHGGVPIEQRVVSDGRVVTGANAASALDLGLTIAARFVTPEQARVVQIAMEYDVDTWRPPFPARTTEPPSEAELTRMIDLMTAGTRAEILADFAAEGGRTR